MCENPLITAHLEFDDVDEVTSNDESDSVVDKVRFSSLANSWNVVLTVYFVIQVQVIT